MDDIARPYPYPRYLRVPFIFIPRGSPDPPELAAFKAANPGWVRLPAKLVPRRVTKTEAKPAEWAKPGLNETTPAAAPSAVFHASEAGGAGPLKGMDLIASLMAAGDQSSLQHNAGAAEQSHTPAPSSAEHPAGPLLDGARAAPFRRIGEALLAPPQPRRPVPWPYHISRAEAQAKFVAACWAAHDQAAASARPGQKQQQPSLSKTVFSAHQSDVFAASAVARAAGTKGHAAKTIPLPLEEASKPAATQPLPKPMQPDERAKYAHKASTPVTAGAYSKSHSATSPIVTGSKSIGAAIGGGVGRAIGVELGAAAGAAGGSLIGPEGTVGGGISGGILGGLIGSRIGAALGSAIEKTIFNAVSGSDTPNEKAHKPLRRPYVRKGTRQAAEAAAQRDDKGRILDPNTGDPIDGKPDLGHKPKHEHRTEVKKAEKQGLTQKEFNQRMNNPDIYQLEDPSSNRSRKFEEK